MWVFDAQDDLGGHWHTAAPTVRFPGGGPWEMPAALATTAIHGASRKSRRQGRVTLPEPVAPAAMANGTCADPEQA